MRVGEYAPDHRASSNHGRTGPRRLVGQQRRVAGIAVFAALSATAAWSAGSREDGALKANRVLAEAAARREEPSVRALLDDQFSWTDQFGVERDKVAAASALIDAGEGGAETAIQARNYGALTIVTGNREAGGPVRFVHIFVERPTGWKAVAFQDNHIFEPAGPAPAPGAPEMPAAAKTPCDNPCKTIPYTPRTPAEAEVIASYVAVERASDEENLTEFARRLANELVIATPGYTGAPITKAMAVASHERAKAAHTNLTPAPLLSAKIAVFGDSAIMISEHPAPKGPTRMLRLWVKRDGIWQLASSAQTRISKSDAAER